MGNIGTKPPPQKSEFSYISVIFFKDSEIIFANKHVTSPTIFSYKYGSIKSKIYLINSNENKYNIAYDIYNEHIPVNILIYDCNLDATTIRDYICAGFNINRICFANEHVWDKYADLFRVVPKYVDTCDFIHGDKQTIEEQYLINSFISNCFNFKFRKNKSNNHDNHENEISPIVSKGNPMLNHVINAMDDLDDELKSNKDSLCKKEDEEK